MEQTESINKILECNNIKPPVEGRCGFFVKRKQRYCKMIPGKGNTFCAEHLCENKDENSVNRKRINCPLDPKHTIFEDKLEKHLKKCNATLKTQLLYYSENINLNVQSQTEMEKKVPLYCLPIEELKELIERIRKCYNANCSDVIAENCSYHNVLDDELNKTCNGPSVKKHLLQQASLINILQQSNAFQDDKIFIEFGAGRGALSHWIQKAIKTKQNNKYLLVDRQHNRNRLDCYHKGEDQGPNFERLNIDIQHLDLGKVESLTGNDLLVTAVGKHLCGGATDLSLRCLMEASKSSTSDECPKKQKQQFMTSRVHTILFALCCYHRCTWSTYVGNDFMISNGFSESDFYRLTKMAAWSTCGFERRENKASEKEISEEENEHAEVNVPKLHVELGLTSKEQAEIGRMCKRLLDHGRMLYLTSYGYQCKLLKYISDDITPENISLIVTRSAMM